MNPQPWILPLASARDVAIVGGKAASLARLIEGGMPVPRGFAITTHAFDAWRAAGSNGIPADMRTAISAACASLGEVAVAVRSSATMEDGEVASMAGQYETVLGARGTSEVLDAVCRCWHSAGSERVRHYLAGHSVDARTVSLALVVQTLIPAESAGVLFTANPRTGRRSEMLLEAAWGIGEAVVSGRVQPDVLVLDHETGDVLEAVIADKTELFDPATGTMRALPESKRRAPVLTPAQAHSLALYGRRIEAVCGTPQDVEWALVDGSVHILQARPITTLAAAELRENIRVGIRTRLEAARRDGTGPWVVHNLGETAPHPTPLTWSLLRRFMSGDGGYGSLQRQIGFNPGESVREHGFLELVAGRIYMDVARAPAMFGDGFPYRYDLPLVRADPEAANGPPTVPAGSFLTLWRAGRMARAAERRINAIAVGLEDRLQRTEVPGFLRWVEAERATPLAQLDPEQWDAAWTRRERRVLDTFAPLALLPSVLCVAGVDRLRRLLTEHFWDEDPEALLTTLCVPAREDQTILANAGLREVAEGRTTLDSWIATHGHRTSEEFELATPRWREKPEAVLALAGHWRGQEDPATRLVERKQFAQQRLDELCARLDRPDAETLRHAVTHLSRHLPYREDGKDMLMRGYDLLRDLALEAGRRLGIGDDVFLLTREEIRRALDTGYPPHHRIGQRRLQRIAERALTLPPFIDEPEIASLGEPPPLDTRAERWKGLPLSQGRASGPVRILTAPDQAPAGERHFILVCPTTDTGWTPLFASIAAVIVERGGSLSHGAVVAREMGVPAVALPDATRLLQDGDVLTVDGHHGWIARGSEAFAAPDSDAKTARPSAPPPPGRKDRRASALRIWGIGAWGAFLAACFALPADVLHDPALRALDFVLWPLVPLAGKVGPVATLAIVTAVLTLVGQRVLNDHARLVAAKRWLAGREKLAGSKDDPDFRRARAMVQNRITLAAFTPLAALLGPMVLSFLWLTARIDPANWSPGPGATAEITAVVAGDHLAPVRLEAGPGLIPAAHSPLEQSLPPIRRTLEQLHARWQATPLDATLPWDLHAAASSTRAELLADLSVYLAAPVPAQTLAWTVQLPHGEPGRFETVLRSTGIEPVAIALVAGDAAPPTPRVVSLDPRGPISEVRVAYRETRMRGDRVFCAPFAWAGLPGWDIGWLGVYLAIYLPTMFIVRRLLRLP